MTTDLTGDCPEIVSTSNAQTSEAAMPSGALDAHTAATPWCRVKRTLLSRLQFDGTISFFQVVMVLGLATGFWCVRIAATSVAQSNPQCGFLYIIALGALGFGGLAGFIFAAAPTEVPIFAQSLTVINGVIGGFAIADLRTEDGIIRKGLHALAAAAGLNTSGGIACTCAYFGVLGFLWLYSSKQYIINPLLNELSKSTVSLTALRSLLPDNVLEVPYGGEPEEPVSTNNEVQALKKALEQPDMIERVEQAFGQSRAGRLFAHSALSSLAKAYYFVGDFNLAIQANKAALRIDPENSELLFYRGNILAAAGRRTEAIAPLEYAIALRGEKAATYKLLGYCLLFRDNAWERSLTMTERYLSLYPNDIGAMINKACALGQRGPKHPKALEVVNFLNELFAVSPWARRRISELTGDGDDFDGWCDQVKSFRALLGGGDRSAITRNSKGPNGPRPAN